MQLYSMETGPWAQLILNRPKRQFTNDVGGGYMKQTARWNYRGAHNGAV